jgi:hypothetical protein
MKKHLLFLLVIFISAGLSAQTLLESGKKFHPPLSFGNSKTPTDTVMPYGIANASTFNIYNYQVGTTNVGYVYGTNNQTKAQAQVFEITQTYFVEEVLFWAVKKDVIGNAGLLTVSVNAADAFGTASTGVVATAPGTLIASTTILSSDIDTSGFITAVPFTTPVYVSGRYAIVFDYTTYGDDSLGLVSCTAGDPGNVETSWQKLNNNTWRTIKKVFSANIDMYMLVVTDQSTAGIESPVFIDGMKLSVSPNPASQNSGITYELENTADVHLKVFDLHGKTVFNLDKSAQATGRYHQVLPASELEAGTYYVSLDVNGKKLTKKLIIQH